MRNTLEDRSNPERQKSKPWSRNKIPLTKGHYAVEFKARLVSYILDQPIHPAMGPHELITLINVKEIQYCLTQSLPPLPLITSTAGIRAFQRVCHS